MWVVSGVGGACSREDINGRANRGYHIIISIFRGGCLIFECLLDGLTES